MSEQTRTFSVARLPMNDLSSHVKDPEVLIVIEKILEGLPLRDAVKAAGLSAQLFHYKLTKDREAAIAYARAQEMRADFLADEVVHIADSDTDPAKVRNQMTARQWLASKLHSKRYGDRLDVNVTQTLDIGATLAEARARLLPRHDLADVIDAEPLVAQGLEHDGASDNKSRPPSIDVEPDIFS